MKTKFCKKKQKITVLFSLLYNAVFSIHISMLKFVQCLCLFTNYFTDCYSKLLHFFSISLFYDNYSLTMTCNVTEEEMINDKVFAACASIYIRSQFFSNEYVQPEFQHNHEKCFKMRNMKNRLPFLKVRNCASFQLVSRVTRNHT